MIDLMTRDTGENRMKTTKGKPHRIRRFLIIFFLILACAVLIFLCTAYPADQTAREALGGSSKVTVSQISEGYLFDGPSSDTAVIFYPGARVETTAYAPLLLQIAEDADVFLLSMPFHLAVLDVDAAQSVRTQYDYRSWYLAGHSLGAAMAGVCAARNMEDYSGVIFLAGYPAEDLHGDGFSLLSIYGSCDGNVEALQKNPEYRPDDYTEVVISGGNHAQFGNYGVQWGDGTAQISREEQQDQAAEAVHDYLMSHQNGTGADS